MQKLNAKSAKKKLNYKKNLEIYLQKMKINKSFFFKVPSLRWYSIVPSFNLLFKESRKVFFFLITLPPILQSKAVQDMGDGPRPRVRHLHKLHVFKANCPLVGSGPIRGVPSVGGLSKASQPVFTRVSKKTTENSERLGRQARPGLNLAPPVYQLWAQYRSGTGGWQLYKILYRGFSLEPGLD